MLDCLFIVDVVVVYALCLFWFYMFFAVVVDAVVVHALAVGCVVGVVIVYMDGAAVYGVDVIVVDLGVVGCCLCLLFVCVCRLFFLLLFVGSPAVDVVGVDA